MIKSVVSKITNVLSIILIVIALIILVSAVFTRGGGVPDVMGHSFMKVLTGSMEPEIRADSIVVTKKIEASQIKEGDVISFYSRNQELMGMPVTHRVVKIEEVDGHRVFTTKGDINTLEDKTPVFEEDLIGKVVFSSHFLGVLINLLTKPYVFFPLVIIPLLVIVISNIRSTVRNANEIARREEEEAVRQMMEEIKRNNKENN